MSQWCLVKLELAPGGEFPLGSSGRAYLLRLPLSSSGEIDNSELAANPKAAFVRRYWPDQPDRSGAICSNTAGWNFEFDGGHAAARGHLDAAAITRDGIVQVIELDGMRRPFRVISVSPD